MRLPSLSHARLQRDAWQDRTLAAIRRRITSVRDCLLLVHSLSGQPGPGKNRIPAELALSGGLVRNLTNAHVPEGGSYEMARQSE